MNADMIWVSEWNEFNFDQNFESVRSIIQKGMKFNISSDFFSQILGKHLILTFKRIRNRRNWWFFHFQLTECYRYDWYNLVLVVLNFFFQLFVPLVLHASHFLRIISKEFVFFRRLTRRYYKRVLLGYFRLLITPDRWRAIICIFSK